MSRGKILEAIVGVAVLLLAWLLFETYQARAMQERHTLALSEQNKKLDAQAIALTNLLAKVSQNTSDIEVIKGNRFNKDDGARQREMIFRNEREISALQIREDANRQAYENLQKTLDALVEELKIVTGKLTRIDAILERLPPPELLLQVDQSIERLNQHEEMLRQLYNQGTFGP